MRYEISAVNTQLYCSSPRSHETGCPCLPIALTRDAQLGLSGLIQPNPPPYICDMAFRWHRWFIKFTIMKHDSEMYLGEDS